MVTQTIKLIMSDKTLDEIRMVKGDTDRAISFEIYSSKEATEPLDPTAWSFKLDIVKPDNTFVETSQNGSATFTLSAQAGAVTGKGYYQLFVYNQYDGLGVYTGQGDFRIDDDILNDDLIESVAEVNGLRFPEDFYTIDDNIAQIDDNTTSSDSTWSSDKIDNEISDAISGITPFSATNLYVADNMTPTNITANITNYDAIIIYVNDTLATSGVSYFFPINFINDLIATSGKIQLYPFSSTYAAYYVVTTGLNYDNSTGGMVITRVDGLKF